MTELLKKRNYRPGPNCWNAAFYVTGHYPHKLYVSSIQASHLFQSSCEKLSVPAAQAPNGSIQRHTDNEGRELHAAIKVGADRYFQKRGYAGESAPYEIGHLDDITETEDCEKSKGCELIKAAYNCPAPPPLTEPLNPLELKINFLASRLSNLIFDTRNPARFSDVNRAVRLIDATLRSEELDTWLRGASRTNLLMLHDIFQSAALIHDQPRASTLAPVLLVSARLIERAEKVRYFTPYERAYFNENQNTLKSLNLKL